MSDSATAPIDAPAPPLPSSSVLPPFAAAPAEQTTASPPLKRRRQRPVQPIWDRKDTKKPRLGSTSSYSGTGAAGVGKELTEEERRGRIGEKYSPGDGQLEYELTAPLPTRAKNGDFQFEDWPEFTPNLSPEEILRAGAFDGGYFRPVKSKKSGRELHVDWTDLPPEWYEGLDVSMYLTRPELISPADAQTSVNRWKPKMGQGYEEWEKNGWIVAEHDARGWFTWYCRFFLGRRCDDDVRQVKRWTGCVGQQSGRWRRIFLDKYRKAGVTVIDPDEEKVSEGIRQTIMHWAYSPTTEHLNIFRIEKGDIVANEDVGEEDAGEG